VAFDGDVTLQLDGLTVVARELGAGEAHNTTAYYLPGSGDLYVGDAVINRLHGPMNEAATGSWLGILDRLDAMFPNVRVVHPGHGVAGSKQQLFADEREYLRTCRSIAAAEIVRSGFTDTAKATTIQKINTRFPYINPTGREDIVKDSVDGLFEEFSRPTLTPIW
jgi:glyoxylase-like metal-dependent hydrolase (beta-lactamase superfamily II)